MQLRSCVGCGGCCGCIIVENEGGESTRLQTRLLGESLRVPRCGHTVLVVTFARASQIASQGAGAGGVVEGPCAVGFNKALCWPAGGTMYLTMYTE